MRHKSMLLTLAALLTLWPVAGFAGGRQGSPPHRHGAPATQDESPMDMEGHQTTAHHLEIQQRMNAMDAELDGLLEAARSASGEEKVQALEDVADKLVERREAMHQMMQDHQEMMQDHQATTMSDCPMMKDMHGEPGEKAKADRARRTRRGPRGT